MARIPTTVAIATLGLLLPLRTAAEPIRAVFAIDVREVTSGTTSDPAALPQPFEAHFQLSVMFDSRLLHFEQFCCPESAQFAFGDPTFGDVPLEHFGFPPLALPFDNHGTHGGWARAEDGSFARSFSIDADLTFQPSGEPRNTFALLVTSGEQTGLPTQPSVELHDLLSTIRPGEFPNFAFSTSRPIGDGHVEFIRYLGQATFLSSSDPAPIPEPSSVALITTGLIGAVWRRRILRIRQ